MNGRRQFLAGIVAAVCAPVETLVKIATAKTADELLIERWIRTFGDPSDPEVKARIESTAQYLRQREHIHDMRKIDQWQACIMQRYNEAMALDHVVPYRLIHK